MLSARTKHIELKEFYLRFRVADKTIAVVKISGKENTADIFTKALKRQPFEKFRDQIVRKTSS